MKSLYTVNRKIKEIENYEDDNKQISMTITYNQLKQIKQDLEVLEIFKKAFGDCEFTFFGNGSAEIEFSGSDLCIEAIDGHTDLKVEEVKKLKQWLEEDDDNAED